MTPPHIETIARAICVAHDEDPDETRTQHPNWRGWHLWISTAKIAFSMSAEICGKVAKTVADNQTDEINAATLNGSPTNAAAARGAKSAADAIETRIRALVPKEG